MKKMRHFLVFALIAVMLIGAVDVDAKTKRKKTSRTKTTKVKKNNDALDKEVIDEFVNLELFQKMVENVNKNSSTDLGDGVTLTSITMEGKTICYDVDVYDAEIVVGMKEMPSLFEGVMKSYMAKYLYEVCSAEEYGDLLVDQMVKLGISICFRFHEQGKSDTLSSFIITAKELKAADTFPEAPSSPVLDLVGVLSPKDVREIAEKSLELDSLKLAQVAVVIVADLKGMKTLDYAAALGNKWGVGHKETNDGITIVVKPKTAEAKGEVAIATGTGMERILTNEMCQRIINEQMIPEFKKNDYGEAIKEAIDKIKEILVRYGDESKLEILD